MKIMRRLLAVFLTAILLLSTAATVFADNYTVYYCAGTADKNESVPKVCKNVDEGDYYTVLRPGGVFDDYDDYIDDGYEFDHWEDQNGKEYDSGDEVQFRRFEDGVLELTAIWEDDDDNDDDGSVSYGVTYSAGDAGKNSKKETYSGDFETEAPESVFDDLAEYKEDGYRFVSWMDKIGNTYLKDETVHVDEAPFNTSYNMTLTALWICDGDYQICFRSGTTEATGSDPSGFYAEYNKKYTLPKNPYTFTGFAFAGWDVGGTIMQPGDTYSVRDGLVIRATWKDAGVELIYQPGEGQGTSYTKTYEPGESITLAENTFTRAGYAFAGWLIESVNTVIPEGTSVVIAGNDTATAQWILETSAPAQSAPAEESSSEAAVSEPESESAAEEETSVPEESEPIAEAEKPETLSYSISGSTPVSGITVKLDGGVEDAELLVTPITEASSTDTTTAALLESGDAAAIFDLALQSDGSAYDGKTTGTVLFEMNGNAGIPEAPYKSARIAMAHVMPLDAFEGSGYYKSADGKTVWCNLTDGSTQESDSVSLVETRGIYRAVIVDSSAAPASFAYLSDDATVVEVALGSDAEASSFEIGFTGFSPFLLLWVELDEGAAALSPLVWVAVGVVVTLALLGLAFLLYRGRKQKAVLSGTVAAAAHVSEETGSLRQEDPVSVPDSRDFGKEPDLKPISGEAAESSDWGEFRKE